MANTERIEDIIDEKAFKQFERLFKDLDTAQQKFIDTANAVEVMNTAVSKSKSFRELTDATSQLTKAENDLTTASEKVIKTTERVAKAEDEVVKATKARISATAQDKKVLEQVSGTLDQNIRLQVRLKAELKAVRDEQKALSKEVASSQRAKQALASRTADLAMEEAQLKAAIQQTNLDIRRSIKEQNAAEGSSAQLSARLDRLRAAYNGLSREQKETVEVGGRLLSQIQTLDKELKKSDATLGVHNRNVGNYKSALEGVQGPLNNYVGGLQNAVSAGRAFISTPIGAVIGAIGAALIAARGWYEYNRGLVEATRLTRQLTGLTGDDLKNFRTEVQATATVFNKDFKETLIATNAVSKQFGISQEESLGLIRQGFLSGADASGEFLDQLREYPSQLKAVGLTAEETIAIITQNVQQGIYSDKGIDAIKEAGIRIREMTPATRDAFAAIGMNSEEIERGLREGTTTIFEVIKQVSQRLSELPPQSREVGMAMADIFGDPGEDAGIAYLTTIKDINTSLDETVKEAGELAEIQQQQLEATEKLDKLTAALFDTTGGTFEAMIANGKLFLTNVLIGMAQGLVSVINYFVDIYNNSILIRSIFAALGFQVKTVFGAIVLVLGNILDRIRTLGKVIGAVLKGEFSSIPGIIRDGMTETVNDAREFGKKTADNFMNGLEGATKGRMKKVSLNLDVTGAAAAASGALPDTGGTGSPYVSEKELKRQAEIREKAAARQALLEKAQAELSKQRLQLQAATARQLADDERESFDTRQQNLETYLAARKQLIEEELRAELAEQKKNQVEVEKLQREGRREEADALKDIIEANVTKAEEIARDKREQLSRESAEMQLTILRDQLSEEDRIRLQALDKEYADERAALASRYAAREISEKQYREQTILAQEAFNRKLIDSEIEAVKKLIEVSREKGVATADLEKRLSDLKARYSKEATDSQIRDAERLAEREKELIEARREFAGEVFDLSQSIFSAGVERENNRLAEQLEQIDIRKQHEIEAANASAATEEEKANRIRIAEANAQIEREKIERKQRQLAVEKAKFDRMAQVAGIIGNTARAVTAALPNIPLSIIVGAIGAAQLAQVLSTPLPRYAQGTESAPEGWAWVSERGPEGRIEPDGSFSVTPSGGPALTYLARGTKIIPHEEMRRMASSSIALPAATATGGHALDTRPLIDAQERSTKKMVKAISGRPESKTVVTAGGVRYFVKKGGSWKEYVGQLN